MKQSICSPLLLSVLIGTGTAVSFGANLFSQSGDWGDPNNWAPDLTVPTLSDAVLVREGNSVTIDDDTAEAGNVYIANFHGSAGTFTMTGGSLNIGSRFFMAAAPGAVATATQSGGDITVANQGFRIAHTSTGSGPDGSNSGTYTMSGGTMTITAAGADRLEVGTSGTGTLTVSGGEITGNNADARIGGTGGTLNLSSGTLAVRQLDVESGGAFNFTGGSLLLGSAGGTHNIDGGLTVPTGGYLGSTDPATIYNPTVTDGGAGTDLAFDNNSTFGLNFSGITGTADQWTVDTLDLSGSPTITLELDLILGSVLPGDQFTFLDYSTLIGDFNNVNWQFTKGGGNIEVAGGTVVDTGSQLYFTGIQGFSIPEPSSMMLIGVGAVLLRFRMRLNRRRTSTYA